jgi:hypothetical protein
MRCKEALRIPNSVPGVVEIPADARVLNTALILIALFIHTPVEGAEKKIVTRL